MGLGGFIEHARKIVESNRSLLKRRKNLKEHLDSYNRSNVYSENIDRKELEERIKFQIHHKKPLDKNLVIIYATSILFAISIVIYFRLRPVYIINNDTNTSDTAIFNANFYSKVVLRDKDTVKYYFYRAGPLAEEIVVKENMTKIAITGYYPSGEIFHKKILSGDTLKFEQFYFKSGLPIGNFPDIPSNKVHLITLEDVERKKLMKFKVLKDKILIDDFNEVPMK